MPVSPTYPGVYIQEVDSGSRVVSGVATSITAFVGRTARGPLDEPVMVYDFGEFQQKFGARTKGMPLTYAVEDFFGNGGGQALIARVVGANALKASFPAPAAADVKDAADKKKAAADAQAALAKAQTDAAAAKAATEKAAADAAADPTKAAEVTTAQASEKTADDALTTAQTAAATAQQAADVANTKATTAPDGIMRLLASSEGTWGNTIRVAVQGIDPQVAADIARRFPALTLDPAKFAMIMVGFPKAGAKEPPIAETLGPVYLDTVDFPVRVDYVLEAQSVYLRCDAPTENAKLGVTITAPKADLAWNALDGGADGDLIVPGDLIGDQATRTGMYMLEHADMFNILVIPGDQGKDTSDDDLLSVAAKAAAYCSDRKAIYIAEPLAKWGAKATQGQYGDISPADLNIGELDQRRRVFAYFPLIKKLDPENGNREGLFSASGMIAGVFAGTDVRRGVWKAPAGIEAGLTGVTNLQYRLSDMQNGVLNQVGINVLRDFPVFGKVVWGSRTLAGADALSDDYKYLPVRRLTDYIELSLFRGTKFAVFEPNTETLWAQLRLTINTFMADLNRQGAFYNYYVQCDKTTTTQFDIDRGRVNVTVAFAPVKPAEFVILTFQQLAGQTAA